MRRPTRPPQTAACPRGKRTRPVARAAAYHGRYLAPSLPHRHRTHRCPTLLRLTLHELLRPDLSGRRPCVAAEGVAAGSTLRAGHALAAGASQQRSEHYLNCLLCGVQKSWVVLLLHAGHLLRPNRTRASAGYSRTLLVLQPALSHAEIWLESPRGCLQVCVSAGLENVNLSVMPQRLMRLVLCSVPQSAR